MKLGLAVAVGLAITGIVALVVYLDAQYPGTLGERDNQISLVWRLTIIVAAMGSLLLAVRSERVGYVARSLLVWGGLGLALIVGYSYWEDLAPVARRVGGQLVPAEPRVLEPGLVSLRASSGGHFRALAEVNGQRVQFLIDTGASDVALTRDDARRVGIDVDRLVYNVPYRTANGTSYGARVRLNRVKLGDIVLDDIGGHVAEGELGQSLLGMSFLRQLAGFEIRGNELILRR